MVGFIDRFKDRVPVEMPLANVVEASFEGVVFRAKLEIGDDRVYTAFKINPNEIVGDLALDRVISKIKRYIEENGNKL